MSDQRLLAIYLNDHLGAATGGVELIRRVAGTHDGERGQELSRLAEEIAEDRESLRALMKRLDVSESTVKSAAGWLAEKAGRFAPNGHVLTRSPLSDVLEIEMLRAGAAARVAGLQVLLAVAADDPRLDREEVERLLDRAQDQEHRLYKIHIRVAQQNLARPDTG